LVNVINIKLSWEINRYISKQLSFYSQ
jgi:hypothetical protein